MQEIVAYSDIEKREISRRYRHLIKSAPFLNEDDRVAIKKAFIVATEAHKAMRRKSGEPYIYHPIEVAQICIEEIGLGATSIICALLHDVVEDTDIQLSEIKSTFGEKVAIIIDGLTKIAGVFEHGTSHQAENFRKMLLTLTKDIRVILIKLADRLHNMRTLGSMSEDKQLKIASETLYLYAPLAHRLGLHSVKSELEDLCLKYTQPEIYKDIARKLQETKKHRESFVTNFIEPLQQSLSQSGVKFELKGRPKSIYSINNKIKGSNTAFEDIYDLFAIRVILDVPLDQEKAACWQAYSIVTDHYRPNPERLKDFISNPKSNGYESLHTTVMSHGNPARWVEVQIRSKRMDEIAEKGLAAHWKYKGNDTRSSEAFEKWLSQIRETLESNDKTKSAVEFVDDLRSSLYNDEVFVFTPKGKLIVLRMGATALDFAYDIHTQVGEKCIGAKVNQRLVPISHKLGNGDQIEILTSAKQKPSEDWLNIVVTSKAKARIKDYIKEANKHYVLSGRGVIEHRLRVMGLGSLTLEVTNQLRAYFNSKDANDLFYRFGKGYLQPDDIKRWKAEREAHERKQAAKLINQQNSTDVKNIVKELKKAHGERKDADFLLIGEDMDKIDYTLAKCCNPIAGDDVFAFTTVNEGIKVHRTNCPNATELLSRHGERAMKAKWASQIEMAFTVHVNIKGTDRVGLMKDVTSVISKDLKVNIQGLNILVKNGIFSGDIALMVSDTTHLDFLMHDLEFIPNIEEVSRVV
jgi:GTP diphosphokinase / guanosine-3',5'-bis(diphosphate) 3'-diphosphatase